MKKIILLCLILQVNISAQYKNGIKVETILKSDTTSIGQKIMYPNFLNNEVTIAKITIPPGKSTGWHYHDTPVFAYVLSGNLTVKFDNGEEKSFSENSAFAEVVNVLHNGFNYGKDDLVLIAFFMGEKGKPLSKHKD